MHVPCTQLRIGIVHFESCGRVLAATLRRALRLFKNQEVVIRQKSEFLDKFESCRFRLSNHLSAWNQLLHRMRGMFAARWIIDNRQAPFFLNSGTHFALKICPVLDMVGGIAKERQVDRIFG